MSEDKIEFNYEKLLEWSDYNGFTMIWSPSESELIVDNKIVDIIKGYNVENRSLDQFISFIDEEDKETILKFFYQDLSESYLNEKQIQQRYKLKDIKGDFVEYMLIGKVIKNNNKYYFVGTSYLFGKLNEGYDNIDSWMSNWKKSRANRTINSIIQCDRITGLPNKYFFKHTVTDLLKLQVEKNSRAAMIIINLDNFKYVNDSYGHDFGDLLLKEVSQSILGAVTEDILVSRYSGDTFLLFKSDITDLNEVIALCNIIIKSFE